MQKLLDTINYQVIGADQQPKCIFLHGILGQGKNWRSIARRFSRKYQCLIFDQRGHGQSFQPETGYGLTDFAQDLHGLLQELGWNEPIRLIGHSMGGRVALEFAHQFPELIEKLVIVDIGPTSDWSSMSAILEKIDFVPVPFASRDMARDFFTTQFEQKYNSPMLGNFFYTNIAEKVPGQWTWLFSESGVRQALEASRWTDYWSYFRELDVPTLLIRGEKSTDLSQEAYEKVIANNPKIKGAVILDAGHWVHAETAPLKQ